MRKLVLLMVLCPAMAFGMDRLSALSMIETGDNDRMVGRAGEISRYQILKTEWRKVTRSRDYANPKVARKVTQIILKRRTDRFRKVFGREPTDFELYGLWNAPSQVLRNRMSARVKERCERYANLCAWTGEATPIPSVKTGHAATAKPGQGVLLAQRGRTRAQTP